VLLPVLPPGRGNWGNEGMGKWAASARQRIADESRPLGGSQAVPAAAARVVLSPPVPRPAPAPFLHFPMSPFSLFPILWLLGVGWCGVRLAGERRRVARLRAAARPVKDRRLPEECAALCRALGVRRAPQLLEVAGNGSPVLVDALDP